MALKLMYITNNLDIALIAQKYGVDRIWIDLETIGKEERQKEMDTVKSHHNIEDIKKIKPYLKSSEMLVRINSWYEGSVLEIENVIAAGADIIMLPYWKTVDEVRYFTEAVGRRCKTTLLLETQEAVECIDDVLRLNSFDEIHIGLNDLHLSYGMTFMFELLADGTVDMLCQKIKATGIPYGFGGIARLGNGEISAENIIEEHYRLKSTRAILSRSFCNLDNIEDKTAIDQWFGYEMNKLREFEKKVENLADDALINNHEKVKRIVKEIVQRRRKG